MNPIDTISKAFPGLSRMGGQSNATRTLPNGGGSYNPFLNNGNVFDPATMEKANDLYKSVPKDVAGGAPVGMATEVDEDISPEQLSSALNSRLYGISKMEVPDAETVATMTPYQQYNAIREQMINERLNGTGAYAIPPGMAYSPDQVRQVYNAADSSYGSRLGEISSVLSNQGGKKFGLDSIFAGLSPTTVSLISGEENKFRQEKGVKDFNIIQNSAIQSKQITDRLAKTKAKGNGADDQRLIYLFAKAQDPDSVVREGEYANASKFLSTIPQSIVSQITRVANIDDKTGRMTIATTPDGFLTPDARAQIVKALEEQYQGSKQSYDNLRSEYSRRINSYSGQQGLGEQMLVNYSGAYDSGSGGIDQQGFATEW